MQATEETTPTPTTPPPPTTTTRTTSSSSSSHRHSHNNHDNDDADDAAVRAWYDGVGGAARCEDGTAPNPKCKSQLTCGKDHHALLQGLSEDLQSGLGDEVLPAHGGPNMKVDLLPCLMLLQDGAGSADSTWQSRIHVMLTGMSTMQFHTKIAEHSGQESCQQTWTTQSC